VRDNTERPITIEQGTNRLIGTQYSNIPGTVKEILSEKSKRKAPRLWDGNASERIAEIVVKKLH
jgi:UDP-N-acetylglucosamine 2-epimerase (non-hydrolysing)